jgi:hypothetical protein
MKICKKCGIEKSLDSFSNNKNKPDGKLVYCKVCKAQIDKKSNLNRVKEIKKTNQKKISKKNSIVEFWKNQKGGKCLKCNESRLHVLDFHHLDENNKRTTVSELVQRFGNNNPLIEQEVNKCILLCSNCHRDFHYLEKRDNLTIEIFLK